MKKIIYYLIFLQGITASSLFLKKLEILPSDSPKAATEAPVDRQLIGEMLTLTPADLNTQLVTPVVTKLGWKSKEDGARVVVFTQSGETEVNLLEVHIAESEGGKKSIELDNTKPTDFPLFKNDHAFYSRGLLKTDTKEKLTKYMEEKFNLFKKSVNGIKKKTLAEISADLQSYVTEKSGTQPTVRSPNDHFTSIDVFRGQPTQPFLTVRIHNINDDLVGINIVQIDRDYEAVVPKANYAEGIKDVKTTIVNFLAKKDNPPLFPDDVLVKLGNLFAPHCRAHSGAIMRNVAEVGDGPIYFGNIGNLNNCAFANTKLFMAVHSSGNLQYYQVKFDHPAFFAEYFISSNPKNFDDTCTKMFKDLADEADFIKKLRTASKKDYKLTLEDLETALKDGLGTTVTVTKEDEAVIGKMGDIVVCKATKNKDTPQFRISFFTPVGKKSSGASNPELVVEEENGFDQVERIKAHAKKFIQGLSLI